MRIAIATISMARTDAEAHELTEALQALAQQNLPMFIADRSSHPEFQNFLRRPPFQILQGAQDLIAQTRLAVQAAANSADAVLYTEPDKKFFFNHHLKNIIENYRPNELHLPSRSQESFRTYSKIQQRVETAINLFSSRLLNVNGDFTYGPILFPSRLAKNLDHAPSHLGWGWRPFLMRTAAREKIPIVLRQLHLPSPENQHADTESEWLHRMRQFNQNLLGLLHEATPQEFEEVQDLFPTFAEAPH